MLSKHSLRLTVVLIFVLAQKVSADPRMSFGLERSGQCPASVVSEELNCDSVNKCCMMCIKRDSCLGFCHSSSEKKCKLFDVKLGDAQSQSVVASGYDMYYAENVEDGSLRIGNKIFIFSSDSKNFFQAGAACRSIGAVFATPQNAEEDDFMNQGHPTSNYYINIRNYLALSTWTDLSTGKEQTYFNWAPPEPNTVVTGTCIMVLKSGLWNDHICTDVIKYVCVKKLWN